MCFEMVPLKTRELRPDYDCSGYCDRFGTGNGSNLTGFSQKKTTKYPKDAKGIFLLCLWLGKSVYKASEGKCCVKNVMKKTHVFVAKRLKK